MSVATILARSAFKTIREWSDLYETLTTLEAGGGGGGDTITGGALEPRSLSQAKANATLFSDFSPAGDGTTNDSDPFIDAVTAALADDTNLFMGYHVLYLDEVGRYALENPVFTSISNLMIIGEGDRAVLVERTGSAAWMSFVSYTNIAILNVGFDKHGTSPFGGVRMVAGNGFWFQGNHMWDSLSPGLDNAGDLDHFAIGSSGGALNPNENWLVTRNFFEDLQPSFGPLRHFEYSFNTVVRGGMATAGVGFWANSDGWMIEDGTIAYNKFIDCRGPALAIEKDVFSANNTSFQRLFVGFNEFDFLNYAQTGMRFGTTNDSVQQTTDIFKDWYIVGNVFRYPRYVPSGPNDAAMKAFVPADSFVFDHFTIQGNRIEGLGYPGGFAGGMLLYAMKNSYVESNVVEAGGIQVFGVPTIPANNKVRNNVCAGYVIGDSHGDFIFTNNRMHSVLVASLGQSNIDGTGNDIDTPTLITDGPGTRYEYNFRVANLEGWDPANLADGASATQTFTITGASTSLHMVRSVWLPSISATIGWVVTGTVSAADTVTVKLTNNTGGAVDLGEQDVYITLEKRPTLAV